MTAIITDSVLEQQLIRERQRTGADRFDEVWEGVYVMSPLANNEHQQLAFRIAHILQLALGENTGALVFVGVNVSDRRDGWQANYRCPDVAVVLPGNPSKDCDTHLCGGPDFLVEIVSPNDRTRDKLDFYAGIGVREVLVVDRDPWRLEMYRRQGSAMELAGASTLETLQPLASETLAVSFFMRPNARGRPGLEVVQVRDGGTTSWSI